MVEIILDKMDYSKLPGWRIEQKFNTKVLIGNWNEERRRVINFLIIIIVKYQQHSMIIAVGLR